jgi:hypothetical protein
MNPAKLPVSLKGGNRLLTAPEFQDLATVPAEVEWFRNIDNDHTKRAYEKAIKDFMLFAGIDRPEKFRLLTRAHVIATAEQRLKELGIQLPTPPEPFGLYAEAVQTGNLLAGSTAFAYTTRTAVCFPSILGH